jgi:hypothetical protein
LVLRDIFWVSGPPYRSEPSTGSVFVENVHSLPGTQANELDIPAYVVRGQNFYAWQFNPEQLFPHMLADNASVVLFGGKVGETRGPLVRAINHAEVEVVGFPVNVTHDTIDIDPEETVIIETTDSNVTASFIEQAQLTGGGRGWGRHRFVAIERRNGEERQLLNDDPSVTHRSGLSPQFGAFVNLYTGSVAGYPNDEGVPHLRYARGNRSADGMTLYLSTELEEDAEGPLGSPRVHWRQKSGPGLVRFVTNEAGSMTAATFASAGTYVLTSVTTDGLGSRSMDHSFKVLPNRVSTTLEREDMQRFVDNAPQDGTTDVLQIVFLQAGDDANGNLARVKAELPLHGLIEGRERMTSASLRLHIAGLDSSGGLDVFTSHENSFGISNREDLGDARTLLTSFDSSSLTLDGFIETDLTAAVNEALDAGASYLSVWFDLEVTEEGVAETIRFSSPIDNTAEKRPLFEVTYEPATIQDLSIMGEGEERTHPTFGRYWRSGDWIYIRGLGWAFEAIPGNTSTSMFLYSVDTGWYYSSDIFHPWTYSYDVEEWVRLPD